MNILLVDDDTTILELLATILENMFRNAHIERCTRPDVAISLLEKHEYELIICDYEMPPHGTGELVYNYITECKIKSTFLLFTSLESTNLEFVNAETYTQPQFNYLKKPAPPKKFKECIKALVPQKTSIPEVAIQEYYGVRIHNFLRFNKTQCDIFLKLGENKFVKILNKDSEYDIDFIDKYILRNIHHFYIQKNDYDQFLVAFGASKFLSFEGETTTTFLQEAQKTHRYLSTLMTGIGISQYVIDIANEVSLKVVEEVSGEKQFSDLLKRLINSKDYTYDHTFLITTICSHICKELDLNNSALQKLSFASLIHDLGISDTKLCYLHDINPEEITSLPQEERSIIKDHHDLLTQVQNIPDLTDDIKNILKYHHLFDEKYTYNPNFQIERLNTIVSIFLVAHAFANELYKNDFNKVNNRDIITVLKYKFKTKNFTKIIKALEISFLKEN